MKQNISVNLRPLSPALAFGISFICLFTANSVAQIPVTSAVPELLPEPVKTELNKQRVPIEATRYLLRERARDQNSKCNPAPPEAAAKQECSERQQRFRDDSARFVSRVVEFNENVRGYTVVAQINEYIKKPRWTDAERTRISDALNKLGWDGNERRSLEQITRVWSDMLARGREFEAEANKGRGPLMPGAGQQTNFDDCAVFALANAAGKPYGFVAAQVTEMISDGKWRTDAERKDPQSVFKTGGLMGGEVILAAEALGRVEIVGSGDFAKTIGDGRPVIVSVSPSGGGAHAVVLTKTFQHGGETFYEMMESYNGPIRRLYLSHTELMVILRENGVAYRPDKDVTVKPLR